MKILEVNRLNLGKDYPEIDEISGALDRFAVKNRIEELNWSEFGYRPDTAFSIAYSGKEIFLKYFVTEKYFKAEKTLPNESVYEDSCVEFFLSPWKDGIYYNLEFNGIGTCLMGSGISRETSVKADPSVIEKIRRKSTVGSDPVREQAGIFSWAITIAIPFGTFIHHRINSLEGMSISANFYKCGDKLKEPHYLSWCPIVTEKPDFHRPEFFGILKFV